MFGSAKLTRRQDACAPRGPRSLLARWLCVLLLFTANVTEAAPCFHSVPCADGTYRPPRLVFAVEAGRFGPGLLQHSPWGQCLCPNSALEYWDELPEPLQTRVLSVTTSIALSRGVYELTAAEWCGEGVMMLPSRWPTSVTRSSSRSATTRPESLSTFL